MPILGRVIRDPSPRNSAAIAKRSGDLSAARRRRRAQMRGGGGQSREWIIEKRGGRGLVPIPACYGGPRPVATLRRAGAAAGGSSSSGSGTWLAKGEPGGLVRLSSRAQLSFSHFFTSNGIWR